MGSNSRELDRDQERQSSHGMIEENRAMEEERGLTQLPTLGPPAAQILLCRCDWA